jgi:AcrR family transcriptional regulator
MPQIKSRRLAAEDWEEAALVALAEGGVETVAVEPLAKRLGVTKGSGYWHFTGRDDLLRRALARWEQRDTEEVIAALARVPDPRQRLLDLFRLAMRPTWGASLYTALFAAAGHPTVGPVLARVAARRLEYLERCYRELGLAPEAARHQALLAYATYVGLLHLAREAPAELPRDAAGKRLAARIEDVLLSLPAARGTPAKSVPAGSATTAAERRRPGTARKRSTPRR